MTTQPLYEFADAYRYAIDLLQESGGELTPDIEEILEKADSNFLAKAEKVGLAIQNLIGLAKQATEESRRLRDLATVRENAARGLKAYLKLQMERVNRDKVETPRIVARIQRNSRPTIAWAGEPRLIPAPYRHTTYSVDGQAAYEQWKLKGHLPSGFVVEMGSHLRIR